MNDTLTRSLSKDAREIYANLREELLGLQYRYFLLNQLYADQDTYDLLLKVSRKIFYTHKADLLDLITIIIGRLCDSRDSQHYEHNDLNASLDQLIYYAGPTTQRKLNRIRVKIINKSKRIRNWRNKWSGHRDAEIVQKIIPYPSMSVPEINEVITLIGNFLNEFEEEYSDKKVEYCNVDVVAVEEGERLRIHEPVSYTNTIYLDDGMQLVRIIKEHYSSMENKSGK
jgi:hypothetical protein